MRQALYDIKTVLLTRNENGGRYHYLAEIGLELTSTGDLKLDETKLNAAMGSYTGDLQKLFQGSGAVNGALDNLKDALANLDGTAGLIKTSRSNIDTSLKALRTRIEAQQLRLDIRRQELTKQYTAADQAMSRLSAATSSLQNLQSRLI
jgi:flagellar hook-associated protein 2